MNQRNTAVKRIHADVRELAEHPSPRYHAAPLDDDIFEWHFTIRGPPDTDFVGGIYHGRILLSPEYPFKPPHIIFLTVRTPLLLIIRHLLRKMGVLKLEQRFA